MMIIINELSQQFDLGHYYVFYILFCYLKDVIIYNGLSSFGCLLFSMFFSII